MVKIAKDQKTFLGMRMNWDHEKKISRRTGAFALLVSLIVSGCVTPYQGPGPDLSLTGEKAREEIKKFSFKEGFWSQGYNGFLMGPDEQRYTYDSVRPLIEKVSPKAADTLSRSESQILVSRIVGGVGDVALLWAIIYQNTNTQQILVPIAIVGLGVSGGFALAAFSNLSSTAEQYNRDLRQKFSPSFGFNYKY